MSRRLQIAGFVLLAATGLIVFAVTRPLADHPPPTPEQYAEKANEVCAAAENKQAKLDNDIFKDVPFDQPPPRHLTIRYVQALLPTYREQLESLRKLTPPKGDAERLRSYFAATERVVRLLEAVAHDPGKVDQLFRTSVFTKADDAARAMELLECAHSED